MTVAYWIVAGLLALLYVAVGLMKIARPREKLASSGMGWVQSTSNTGVKLIGALEVLGAIGLILPPLTHVLPWLAIAAAVGLVVLQIGAVVTHVRRGELRNLPVNAVLIVLAAVAAVLAPAVTQAA
ncbi:DoxX family protein [uncultured Amnibacterium sp.]|uniref:DoxX family protein n=1 Tax=uncultured Amnibacterium sp. TaxID=1631851 RepID=UPI0035CCA9E7